MSAVATLLARETALAWGKGGGPMVAVGFYAGVATLLPLAVGSEPERLAGIAPGAASARGRPVASHWARHLTAQTISSGTGDRVRRSSAPSS